MTRPSITKETARMKVVITTTYENVDQAWLGWWVGRLESSEGILGSVKVASTLLREGRAEWSSKDPTSEVIATTKYEVIR